MAKTYAQQIEESNKYVEGAEPASELRDQITAKASDAVDYVTAEARKAASDPRGYYESTKASVVNYARAEPIKALGIAAGVGFLYGALRSIGRR